MAQYEVYVHAWQEDGDDLTAWEGIDETKIVGWGCYVRKYKGGIPIEDQDTWEEAFEEDFPTREAAIKAARGQCLKYGLEPDDYEEY